MKPNHDEIWLFGALGSKNNSEAEPPVHDDGRPAEGCGPVAGCHCLTWMGCMWGSITCVMFAAGDRCEAARVIPTA